MNVTALKKKAQFDSGALLEIFDQKIVQQTENVRKGERAKAKKCQISEISGSLWPDF